MEKTIFKHQFDNGFTVLVVSDNTVPKVSVQLWIGAGSAQEKTGQRGVAHFLEHLLFKGTNRLSETDLIHIVDKLSGYCNAMTSHDFTMYQFDFPKQHWQIAPDLLADIMCNAQFKQDLFNSELCAVVQELKLYKDDYSATLEEEMISLIFSGHPYHYPIIGYKQELWDLTLDAVESFYRAHYVPNNATLVVVGDVTPDEVIEVARKCFDAIPAHPDYKKGFYPFAKDIRQSSITLRREIEQLSGKTGFIVPGVSAKKSYELDVLAWIIARGRGSRLYKKLVEELECVVDVDAYIYPMVQQSVFFIDVELTQEGSFERVEEYITAEFLDIIHNGITEHELERATNQVKREHYLLLEDTTALAEEVGFSYVATGDHTYLMQAMDISMDDLKRNVQELVRECCANIYANIGRMMPMDEDDVANWQAIQEASDYSDTQKRADRERVSLLEPLRYSEQVMIQKPVPFVFPQCHTAQLSNGCDLLWYHRDNTSLITVVLDLGSNHYVDPADKQGCYSFMFRLLLEGTKKYSAAQLAQQFEHAGIAIDVKPRYITMNMFSGSLGKALDLLKEILTDSLFDQDKIEWVREQIIAEIKDYWDEPTEYIKTYAYEQVYKNHPYAKNELGTLESIEAITRDDLLSFYRSYITPRGSAFSIVGNLADCHIPALLEKIMGEWTGSIVEKPLFSALAPLTRTVCSYDINRDQVVLGFAGLSITRTDPAYDAWQLLDYYVTGGSARSMGSRLFQLREQSGLFYSIGGSLLFGSDEQPGMIYITTIVSPEAVDAAQQLIEKEIDRSVGMFGQKDLVCAQNALINSLVDCAASNQDLAFSFLFLRRYKFTPDYFEKRADVLSAVSVDEIVRSMNSLFSADRLVVLRVGRV